MDSLDFLEKQDRLKPQSIYVVCGDEDFLKRRVLAALKKLVLGAEEDSFEYGAYAGDKSVFSSIRDELDTMPFVGSRRLVVVENADPFVTKFRPLLEKYVEHPSSTGVLVLDVKSWPATTNLAKKIDKQSTIECKSPPPFKMADWCVGWAKTAQAKQLSAAAARLLVDLVGPDMGLLDQELIKLSIYVGTSAKIDTADVDKLVGSSRAENIWKIFDAIGEGQSGQALTMLDNLFDQGEEPMRLLGAFSMQLRRMVQVYRLHQQGRPLPQAMEQAGVPPFGRRGCEQQLRHLGGRRLDRIYDWLVETDLGLKGSSQLPHQTVLERLVVRLAKKN